MAFNFSKRIFITLGFYFDFCFFNHIWSKSCQFFSLTWNRLKDHSAILLGFLSSFIYCVSKIKGFVASLCNLSLFSPTARLKLNNSPTVLLVRSIIFLLVFSPLIEALWYPKRFWIEVLCSWYLRNHRLKKNTSKAYNFGKGFRLIYTRFNFMKFLSSLKSHYLIIIKILRLFFKIQIVDQFMSLFEKTTHFNLYVSFDFFFDSEEI